MFDVEEITTSWNYYPESGEGIQENFESAGYDSSFLVLNLELSFYSICFHVCLFVLYWALRLLQKACPKVKKANDKLGDYLFWNGTLRLFMELYMEVTLLTLFNLKVIDWETGFKAVFFNNLFVIIMTGAVLVVPIILLIFAACKYK